MDMTDQGDRPATPTSGRLLAIYLRHHAAASKGGLDLFERAARQQTSPEARRELRQLAAEIAEDRSALLGFLDVLGVPRPRLGERLMGWGEKLGRLKPNGTLIRRSPLSDIVELEALGVAVQAKKLGWLTLRRLAETDHRLDVAQLDELVRRATGSAGPDRGPAPPGRVGHARTSRRAAVSRRGSVQEVFRSRGRMCSPYARIIGG